MENLSKEEIVDKMKRLDESNLRFILTYSNLFYDNFAFEKAKERADKSAAAWKEFIDEREQLFNEISGKSLAPAGEWIQEGGPVEVQVIPPSDSSESQLGDEENK